MIEYSSPCGIIALGEMDGLLCMCDWTVFPHHDAILRRLSRLLGARFEKRCTDITSLAAKQLDEYFEGRRVAFDIPILTAGTDFQQSVWNGLKELSYGETLSYGQFAVKLGCPAAVRAVAGANGANALSIILPCHRIIGGDMTLGGYGGGLPAKQYLLDLERRVVCC